MYFQRPRANKHNVVLSACTDLSYLKHAAIAEEVKEMAKDAKLIAAIHVLLLEDLHLHQKNTRTTIDSLKVEAEFLRVEADKIKKVLLARLVSDRINH